MNKLFLLCLISILSVAVNAQTAFSSFEKECPEASISFCLKDIKTGRIEMQENAKKALAPASVLKLLSTIAVLDKYYKKDNFYTEIGYTGEITKGILKGSLLIKASGDPTWNSKFFPTDDVFKDIVKIIKARGIREIQWGIIIDENGIDSSLPRTWIWEDIANYFGSPAKAINIFDNTYTLNFSSSSAGKLTNIQSIEPKEVNLNFTNEVLASSESKDDAWIFGGPYSSVRVVKGSIPQNRTSFKVKGSISNTNEVFAKALIARLSEAGIDCNNKLLIKEISSYNKLGELTWPSLDKIIYFTNQHSVNLYAEALSKKIDNIQEYWSVKGLDTSGIKLYDGSGVSRFNMLNSAFICDLLVYAHKQKYNKILINSLPKAGVSGTLKRFGNGSCLENNLVAKTGSMKAIRSYAGYISIGSQRKAFSIIINNYNCEDKEIIKLIENFLISLCK